MRLATYVLVPAALAVGCGRTPKVDNPVLGPPPPRVSMDDGQGIGGEAFVNDPLNPTVADIPPGELVRTVAANDGDTGFDSDTASASKVVARVNGEPIFEGDVLEPYAGQIVKNRDQMSDAEFAAVKKQLAQRDLPSHIDRKLLIQALRKSLQAEQFTSIEDRLATMFEEEEAKMRERYEVTTNYELGQKLAREGQSLDAIRRSFVNQQLAMVYMGQNAKREFEIGRTDLLDYYERNRDEYEIEAKVRWQRFLVRFDEHGGKAGAVVVLQKAVDELKRQTSFEDVIRAYSDGPRAKKGGHWDWTRKGELVDQRIEKALFRLPVGELSQFYTNDESYQIVMVLEREDGGMVPFSEVQEEVQLAVENELRGRETDRILDELKATAEITSLLDERPEPEFNLPFN